MFVCLSPNAEMVTKPRYIVVSGRFGGATTEPATQEGKSPEHGLVSREFKDTHKGYDRLYVTRFTADGKPVKLAIELGWLYNVKTVTQASMVNGSILGALNVAERGVSVGGAGQSGITDTQQIYIFMGKRCVVNETEFYIKENDLRFHNCVAAKNTAERDPKKRKWAAEMCHEKIAGTTAQAPAQGQTPSK
jgi:hypothetical protein